LAGTWLYRAVPEVPVQAILGLCAGQVLWASPGLPPPSREGARELWLLWRVPRVTCKSPFCCNRDHHLSQGASRKEVENFAVATIDNLSRSDAHARRVWVLFRPSVCAPARLSVRPS